jgi:hypothetical protein
MMVGMHVYRKNDEGEFLPKQRADGWAAGSREGDAVLRTAGTRRGAPGVEPIEASRAHLRDAIMPEEPIKPPSRLRMIWPALAVGVGLLGVLVWTLFLGWLLGHALLAIF